jgi:hypothetical protein
MNIFDTLVVVFLLILITPLMLIVVDVLFPKMFKKVGKPRTYIIKAECTRVKRRFKSQKRMYG